MHPSFRVLGLAITTFGAACSTTPGDAARRSNHPEAAAKLYEKGAAQGDALAARKLAELSRHQPRLPENRQEALRWYKRAFELGDQRSAWEIGTIYKEGKGNVPHDAVEAERWFQKGAEAGHHYAMYALAESHADDAVTPRDDVRGLMWLNAVSLFAQKVPQKNEGHQFVLTDPRNVRRRLESRMSPAQIAEAGKLAEEWVARYEAKQRQ